MFCYKCGAQVADDSSFCAKCGANLKAQSVHTEPVEEPEIIAETENVPEIAVSESVENERVEPIKVKTPSIAGAIVALSLGLTAIYFAFISFITVINILSIGYGDNYSSTVGQILFLALPAAVSSITVGNNYLNSNATRLCPMAKAGKILGIVSVSLSGFVFFLALIALTV